MKTVAHCSGQFLGIPWVHLPLGQQTVLTAVVRLARLHDVTSLSPARRGCFCGGGGGGGDGDGGGAGAGGGALLLVTTRAKGDAGRGGGGGLGVGATLRR